MCVATNGEISRLAKSRMLDRREIETPYDAIKKLGSARQDNTDVWKSRCFRQELSEGRFPTPWTVTLVQGVDQEEANATLCLGRCVKYH